MTSSGSRFGVGARLGGSTVAGLVRAAQPRRGLMVTVAVSAAAAVTGRPPGEVLLVAVTVLVGQCLVGWDNDLVDRDRDARHDRPGKPLATGQLDPSTAWFAVACGVLVVVPLSVANGVAAGIAHLALLVVAAFSNHGPLRRTWLSWVPWALGYAWWPAFLSYGGAGGGWPGAEGTGPPTWELTVLAALLGVGVHVALALPGLVADNQDGFRHLPLRIALRIGAPRLLVLTVVWLVLVAGGIVFAGATVGLRQ